MNLNLNNKEDRKDSLSRTILKCFKDNKNLEKKVEVNELGEIFINNKLFGQLTEQKLIVNENNKVIAALVNGKDICRVMAIPQNSKKKLKEYGAIFITENYGMYAIRKKVASL